MNALSDRRRRLFSGAGFSSALFYSGNFSGSPSASFRYFSGCGIDGSYLLLKRGGGTLLAPEMNYSKAKSESHYPVRLLGADAPSALRKAAGRGRAAFCAPEMPASRYLALGKRAKLRLVDAGEKIGRVMGEKDGRELSAISKSAAIARGILDSLDPWECKTEEGLAARLKIAALKAGAECSFEPIVATDKNTRFPHHIPSAKRLGGIVLVDFGVKKGGYCSDLTRCYFRGACAREREAYGKCERIFRDFLDRLPECENGRDACALGESLLRSARLPKMAHLIGHGIGLEVHEFPRLSPKSKDPLSRAALCVEPAAYFQNFGVRFEEMAASGKRGWRIL